MKELLKMICKSWAICLSMCMVMVMVVGFICDAIGYNRGDMWNLFTFIYLVIIPVIGGPLIGCFKYFD